MATQLEIQAQINKLISVRGKMLEQQTEQLTKQVAVASGLAKAIKGAKPEDVTDSINKMAAALKQTSEAADEVSDSSETMAEKIAKALLSTKRPFSLIQAGIGGITKAFPLAGGAVAGFVDGVVSGFKFATRTLRAFGDLAISIGTSILDIGKAIISIPFKILEGLIGISNKLTGYMEAVARATEEVRTQFGELSSGPGKAVVTMARQLEGQLAKTGLNGYRIFGSLDERLQFVNKIATEMGAVFEVVRDEMVKNGDAILVMQKGLGLTGDDMGAIARRSRAFGSTLTDELLEISKVSIQFGKRFGLSSKGISRDVAMMIKDAKNFGNLGPKALVKVSVQAKKLGLDVKDLLGVIEGFDTFEDAAMRSAKLGQAFGVNIDAMKMMKAENPAERVEMLRDAFFAAGKSAEQLTRQELKLLAQTANVSEETARAAFSQKNMGVSLAELEKQGKQGEKQQLSQEEVLMKLADSVERMVKAFGQFEKGFGQAFVDGFARGVFAQKDFTKALWTLNRALAATKRAGMAVGRAFVEMFPGVMKLVKGFTEFFQVVRDGNGNALSPFAKFLDKVVKHWKTFFGEIANDPDALPNLFNNIRNSFVEFLKSFNTKEVTAGANAFAQAMGNVVAGVIRMFADGFDIAIEMFEAFMTGKDFPDVPGKGLANKFLDPIKAEFEKGEAGDRIGKSFAHLFREDGPLMKAVTPVLKKAATFIAVTMLGTAFIKSAIGALAASLTAAFTTWLLGGGAVSLGGILASAGTTIMGGLTAVLSSPITIAAAIGASAVGISTGMKKFRGELDKEFDKTEAMAGASVAGIVDTLSFGLVPESLSKQIGRFTAKAMEMVMGVIESLPFGSLLKDGWSEMIQSTLEMMSSLGDLIKAVFSGDSDKMADAAKDFGGKFVKFFLEKMYLLPALIKGTVASLLIEAIKYAFAGAWLVVTDGVSYLGEIVFKALGLVSHMIAGVFDGLANMAGEIPLIGKPLKFVIGLVSDLFGALGLGLTDIGNWFADTRKYFRMFNRFVVTWGGEMVEKIKGAFNSGITAAKEVFSFSTGKKIVKLMIKGMTMGLLDPDKGIGAALKEAAKSGIKSFADIWKIDSPSKVAAEMGQSIVDGMMNTLGGMPKVLTDVAEKGLDGVEDTFSGNTVSKTFKGFTSPMIDVVKDMVKETDAINESLEKLGPIDIDAKLQQLADRLGIDNQEMTIKHRNFNINVNLNVIMESDKIADAVIDTRKVVSRDNE